MVSYLLILKFAVQVYECHIQWNPVNNEFHIFHLDGYITNSQRDQLRGGLIAQKVKHCIGITEVTGSNSVRLILI